jgi:hypothetical protein
MGTTAVIVLLLLATLAGSASTQGTNQWNYTLATYPLHYAIAEFLDFKVIKHLVEVKKISVNRRDKTGQTPLHVAMLSDRAPWDSYSKLQYDISARAPTPGPLSPTMPTSLATPCCTTLHLTATWRSCRCLWQPRPTSRRRTCAASPPHTQQPDATRSATAATVARSPSTPPRT